MPSQHPTSVEPRPTWTEMYAIAQGRELTAPVGWYCASLDMLRETKQLNVCVFLGNYPVTGVPVAFSMKKSQRELAAIQDREWYQAADRLFAGAGVDAHIEILTVGQLLLFLESIEKLAPDTFARYDDLLTEREKNRTEPLANGAISP